MRVTKRADCGRIFLREGEQRAKFMGDLERFKAQFCCKIVEDSSIIAWGRLQLSFNILG